jgi:predicted nucleic acid-binding protein
MAASGIKRVYADTSFLVSHFINDANTNAARVLIGGIRHAIMISALGRLEYRTAMWQRVARGDFTAVEARLAVAEFERQAAKKRFIDPGPPESKVWPEAERLSDAYTGALRLRSLDILHVSFALCAGARRFWSFDDRQRALARAAGLEVNR